MKHLLFSLVLFMCTVLVISCSNNNQTGTTSSSGTKANRGGDVPPFEAGTDTLSVDSAQVYIANYGTYCQAYYPYMITSPTRAFVVDSNDFMSVLGIESLGTVKAVRIYIGLKASQATSKAPADTNFHLFIVPMGQDNSDSIPIAANGKKFVYDLTTPCPPTCDSFSRLYEAFTNSSIANITWPSK